MEIEVNESNIKIHIKLLDDQQKTMQGIANIRFEWFEIIGFTINKKIDGNTRHKSGLYVSPPTLIRGKYRNKIFRTCSGLEDEDERTENRKEKWYQVEDAILNAYEQELEKNNSANREIDNNYEKSVDKDDDEINLDDIPF